MLLSVWILVKLIFVCKFEFLYIFFKCFNKLKFVILVIVFILFNLENFVLIKFIWYIVFCVKYWCLGFKIFCFFVVVKILILSGLVKKSL